MQLTASKSIIRNSLYKVNFKPFSVKYRLSDIAPKSTNRTPDLYMHLSSLHYTNPQDANLIPYVSFLPVYLLPILIKTNVEQTRAVHSSIYKVI